MKRILPGIAGAASIGVLSTVYLLEAWDLPFGGLNAPDMGFFPKCLGLFSIFLCALYIIKTGWSSVRSAGNEDLSPRPAERASNPHGYYRGLAVVLILLLYPLLLKWGGFLVSTPLMLFAAFRVVRYRTWLSSLVIALVISAMAYLLFSYWMGVYFPTGFLG